VQDSKQHSEHSKWHWETNWSAISTALAVLALLVSALTYWQTFHEQHDWTAMVPEVYVKHDKVFASIVLENRGNRVEVLDWAALVYGEKSAPLYGVHGAPAVVKPGDAQAVSLIDSGPPSGFPKSLAGKAIPVRLVLVSTDQRPGSRAGADAVLVHMIPVGQLLLDRSSRPKKIKFDLKQYHLENLYLDRLW